MKRLIVCALVASGSSWAQEPFEVRRAEPVEPEASTEVRRAEPAVPPAVPATPDAVAAGEIRVLPSAAVTDPRAGALAQADNFYREKMHDLAVPKYVEFLQMQPRGIERQPALFRLGESLLALERREEASTAYRQVLEEFQSGEFIGPAAYRLGEMQYAARDFEASARSFAAAAFHVRDPKLRLAAKFFQGRSLDEADRRSEALAVYREVVAQETDNPYRERAMFDLAEADARAGLREGAFRQFRRLSETATNAPVRVAAAVKAGLLAIDGRDLPAARPLLEQAAAQEELVAWRTAALSGLLRLDYEEGNYQAVADRAAQLLPVLAAEAQPEALLLAANAHRQLGAQQEALSLYDRLVMEHPESSAAREAGFHRLVSLVAQGDERAAGQIDEFLEQATDPAQKARVSLLKAEMLFERRDYAGAEPLYAAAAMARGAEQYRADALYKLAWSRLQQQKYDQAVAALTSFLTQYPRHPLAATAYAQRALAQLETGQRQEALADFGVIIDKFPKAREREDAMLQRALLLGNLERPAEMTAAFERLLAEYPESSAAAQAQFWIGVAAFDGKKYREALEPLDQARQRDSERYGERATLRLLLSHYYLEDLASASREASALGPDKVPAEVRTWIGLSSLEAGDYPAAAEALGSLAAGDEPDSDVLLAYARAQVGAGRATEAQTTSQKVLPRLHEPKTKARAHLFLSEAYLGSGDGENSKEQAEAALKLQPEGRLNAEARLANGRALLAQDRYDDAARAFMALALLYDEADLSPQALTLAEQAYRRADNTEDAERAREELQRRYPEFPAPAPS